MKFACLLANGFEETEAITVIDCLRRAGVEVDIVSIHEMNVKGSHGISVVADKLFSDMDHYDGLFLPGGQPGSTHLGNDERVLSLVRDYANKDKWISAICAAPTVLAKAGILVGKHVTSYPSANTNGIFDDSIYLEDLVVVDGKLVTSRAMGTAIHLGLKLVQVLGYDSHKLSQSILFQTNSGKKI
jgi:protein deglycase